MTQPPEQQPEPSQQPPQPPYGTPQPPPYGAPPPYGYAMQADHPQATTVLILGIVSIVVCGLVGPFAWVMGNRVVGEIDASGGQYGGRSSANAGRIIGMIVTILLGLSLLFVVAVVIIAVIGVSTSSP
ncbi:DUF4190 domain-containing protein [Nocardioides anomalus]|nr:DUF4190 domain-containing protein [Nocardioides anomalus]